MSIDQGRVAAAVDRVMTGIRNRTRRLAIGALTAPHKVGIADSTLAFHIHSAIEDVRVRHVQEHWTISWIRAMEPGSVLYDVGANIGVSALIGAEQADRGVRVVAIEPFPANFASLIKNIVLNGLQDRVTALPIGLGQTTGIFSLNWAGSEPGRALHSFSKIVRPRTSELMNPVARHHCICYRLDDLVRLSGLPFPTHIKIDVDGGELEVLAGAAEVLRDPRCRALQIECTDTNERLQRSRDVINVLRVAGFSPVNEYAHAFPRVRDIQFSR